MNVLDLLYAKNRPTVNEFDFDRLWIPPMLNYITLQDIANLDEIALSSSIRGGLEVKFKMIDQIMVNRGFRKFGGGTNRLVYRHLEDDRFVAKIAVDKVGVKDNPNEYINQQILKPFVSKMFEVSPNGTVAFCEKVIPIRNKAEFREVGNYVYDLLTNCIIGIYVMDDIGTDFFLNYGVRPNFGPVILDYPYLFELDGRKLYCRAPIINPITNQPTGHVCDGEIDYDDGFNYLICRRCGKRYFARDIAKDAKDKRLLIEGDSIMAKFKAVIKQGNKIIGGQTCFESDFVKRPGRVVQEDEEVSYPSIRPRIITVSADTGEEILRRIEEKKKPEPKVEEEENKDMQIETPTATIEIPSGKIKDEYLYMDSIIDFAPSGLDSDSYNQLINNALAEIEEDFKNDVFTVDLDLDHESAAITYTMNYIEIIDNNKYTVTASILEDGSIFITVYVEGIKEPIGRYRTSATEEGWELPEDDESEPEVETEEPEAEEEPANLRFSEVDKEAKYERIEDTSYFNPQKERRADRRKKNKHKKHFKDKANADMSDF